MRTSYNLMRDDAQLLEEYVKSPPSFSIHLYPEHWTLNNGPKFLYNNQVSSLLDDIRAFRIPTDFIELFDSARVPYYDGCLIVELLDYRPQKAKDTLLEKPDTQRVILRPNAETLWADICLLNQKLGGEWTDMDALEVEARIVAAISPPLCLAPDPYLNRMVNNIVRVSTPNTPHSLKRSSAYVEPEEDESDKIKRARLMQFMNPKINRHTFHPSYRILHLQEARAAKMNSAQSQPTNSRPPTMPPIFSQMLATNADPTAQTTVVPTGLYIQPPRTSSVDPPRSTTATPVLTAAQTPDMTVQPSQNTQQIPTATMVSAMQETAYSSQNADPLNRLSPVKLPQTLPTASPRIAPMIAPPPPQSIQQGTMNGPQAQSQPQSQSRPPSQPQAQPSSSFQPLLPPPHFLNAPPSGKRRQSHQASAQQSGTSSMTAQLSPQMQHGQLANPMTGPHPQGMHINLQAYAQVQRQMQQAQQAQAQSQGQVPSGRMTPSGPQTAAPSTHSPMNNHQHVAGRSSPMIANQQIGRASPMVSNQALAGRNSTPQGFTQHPQTQHPQQQQAPNAQHQQLQPQAPLIPHQVGVPMNYPMGPSQYNQTHLRSVSGQMHPLVQQYSGRPQPSPTPGQQVQYGAQQQPQVHQQQPSGQDQATAPPMMPSVQFTPHMYNYALPMAQWGRAGAGIGRGAPQVMNGQQQLPPGMYPGMTHPQMQGMGRAMPGR